MTDKNLTEIVAIIDRSGSMASLVDDTIGGFNTFVQEQKKGTGKALLSLYQFDNYYQTDYEAKDINEVVPLDGSSYVPRGGTALFDAVARTVNAVGHRLARTPEDKRPGTVIFLIITDGQENASREFSQNAVRDMVKHQIEKYNWEFVYMGGGDLETQKVQGLSLGIMPNKVYAYSTTNGVGTQNLYKSAGAAFTRRREAAAVGISFNASTSDMLDAEEVKSLVQE